MTRRIARALFFVVLLQAAGCTLGSTWRKYPPDFQHKFYVATPSYQRMTLRNGAEVAVAERHDVPVVHIAIFNRAGSAVDPMGQRGLAAVSWTTALYGAGGRDLRAMVTAFESIGGEVQYSLGPEGVVFQVTVLKERFPAAAALLTDIVRRPNLRAEDLERVKRQLHRLDDDEGEDFSVARRVLARHIFGDHPAGRVALAPGRYGIRAVRAFHKYYVGPENTFVVVAGDVTPEEVAKRMHGLLGSWTSRVHTPSPPPPAEARRPVDVVFVPRPGSREAVLAWGKAVPQLRGQEAAALQAALEAVGGRIYSELRSVNGYSYAMQVNHQRLPGAAWFYAIAPVPAENAGEAIADVRDSLPYVHRLFDQEALLRLVGGRLEKRILRSYPLPIYSAQISAYAQTIWRLDTVADLARSIGHLYLHRLPTDHYDEEIRSVRELEEDDVRTVMKRDVRAEDFHLVVVGDPDTVRPQLEDLDLEVVEVDVTGKPIGTSP